MQRCGIAARGAYADDGQRSVAVRPARAELLCQVLKVLRLLIERPKGARQAHNRALQSAWKSTTICCQPLRRREEPARQGPFGCGDRRLSQLIAQSRDPALPIQ